MKQEMNTRGGKALAQAVRKAYSDGQTDYTMEPLVQRWRWKPAGNYRTGDAVIFLLQTRRTRN